MFQPQYAGFNIHATAGFGSYIAIGHNQPRYPSATGTLPVFEWFKLLYLFLVYFLFGSLKDQRLEVIQLLLNIY